MLEKYKYLTMNKATYFYSVQIVWHIQQHDNCFRFPQYDGPEKSKKTQTCLKQLEEDKLALQKELEIEKEAKSQQDEAFKKLQEENDRLEKAVKKEREELKRMNTKVADLKKSQKEYRSSTEDLKTRISQMMANSDEDKKTIKKLHKDLMISSLKHGNENAEAADIKALEDRLTEQQKQNLEKKQWNTVSAPQSPKAPGWYRGQGHHDFKAAGKR